MVRFPGGKTILQALILRRMNIFRHIADGTVQDPAQIIQGCCGDGLIFAQLVNGGAGNVVLLNQSIRGFRGRFESAPKGRIYNHVVGSPSSSEC